MRDHSAYKQTMFDHYGENTGNCFQCAIAYCMNMSVESVPHFVRDSGDKNGQWHTDFVLWLRSKGCDAITMSLEDAFYLDTYYIVLGDSPRKGISRHAVVYKGNKMIFDPHPSDEGLTAADTAIIIVTKL